MPDASHSQLVSSQNSWREKFMVERNALKEILGSRALAIEHIGSTSITALASKPIVDIAVLMKKRVEAEQFIPLLQVLGYVYDESCSSKERMFFRKGTPTEFHLSLAYQDQGSFWTRQIVFRDYLNTHSKVRDEYERLKKELLIKDPTGKEEYIQGKGEFIQKVLQLADDECTK